LIVLEIAILIHIINIRPIRVHQLKVPLLEGWHGGEVGEKL
jgi:hypothetical protein